MKSLWAALVGLGMFAGQVPSPAPAPSAAAGSPPGDPTAYHAVVLKLGPKWDKTRSVREQPGIQEHGQYMSSLSSSGILILGGPFLEGAPPATASGAIVFFATADPAEARRLMEADPGVKSGLFEIGEVRRFVVSTGSWRPRRRTTP